MNQIAKAAARSELLRYAPHIDGLRAIAIVAVVGNHIGLPGFSGGYVGVDIFFVISGFLIITQIVDDLNRHNFSFGDFWSRRALRILPPLFIVLAVSVAIGCYVSVTSGEFFTLGQEALYSALMVINFLLLAQQGYFDAMAWTKPFLHIWSLAVEEQFYLVAPLLLALAVPAFRRWPRTVTMMAAAAMVASLVASVFYSKSDANLAFYLMPTRAWEFMVGGAIGLAIPYLKRLPGPVAQVLSWGGLVLLLATICGYRPDANYPSYLAIAPVLGAAIVIGFGLAFPGARSTRLMSSRPLVWIGLVSYAWYLWHWPLIVFARQYHFGHLGWPEGMGLAAASLVLAWLTRIWVELPIKRWRVSFGRLDWKVAAGGTVAAIVLGTVAIGAVGPFIATAPRFPGFDIFAAPNAGACRIDKMKTASPCLAQANGRRIGLLLGDSHAAAAFGAVETAAENSGGVIASVTLPSCPGVLHLTTFADNVEPECNAAHDKLSSFLSNGEIPAKYAVLLSYWQLYAGDGLTLSGASRRRLGEEGATAPANDQGATFVRAMRDTVSFLRTHSVEKIVIVGPTPDFPSPDCGVRATREGLSVTETCTTSRIEFEDERTEAMAWLTASVAGLDGVRLVDPIDAFCDSQLCHSSQNGAELFDDADHLSPEGAIHLVKYLGKDLEWAMAP